ncbi:MAG TPA: PAS domain S-box protein [Hanamia sp.]|nr:PAS domain S-box protein [Hanamia sp.]
MRKNELNNLDNLNYAPLEKRRSKSLREKAADDPSTVANKSYWALFEKSKNPLLMIDGSFRFIKCNNATLNLLCAASKDQVINKPPSYFSPEYQPDGQLSTTKAAEMIRRAYEKGQHQFEWVHKRLDGILLSIRVSLTSVPFRREKMLLVNWENITEHKKAEETIHKLHQAIEQTKEIVFMTDVDGTINFVNAAFEQVYGYKKGEVVGKVTPRILKSGLMGKNFYDDLWEKLPNGKSLNRELINKTKDGRLINIYTSWSPVFDDEKQVIGYMCVQQDITEKKIAERKLVTAEIQYRTLFEEAPDGICLIDYQTLLPLDFNTRAHKQLGYSRKEFSGLKISDYEALETAKVIKSRVRKIMINGGDDFISKHITKNGEVRDVQVIVRKIILDDKPVFYAIYRDITEKVRLSKALKLQEENLQRQIIEATLSGHEAEKNELGRELHDNVNQLLATVKIYMGMVKSKIENIDTDLLEKSYQFLNTAMDELRRLSHSLVAPALKDKGLLESLKVLIEEVNLACPSKGRLIFKIREERIPDQNMALTIYRIIQEQMNNICKHAKAQTVLVHLTENEGHLELSVLDDGIGFDASKTGTGIGLRNIQSRVEIFSGTVNILSSPGKGCELRVKIPLKYVIKN